MKFLSRRTRGWLALALIAALTTTLTVSTPTLAPAQDAFGSGLNTLVNGETASRALGAVSTDTAILIRYVGVPGNTPANASGTVTVASNGDITLKVGASSAEAADAAVKCPSGGSAGIIDVSDAACNTLGEVVDIINAASTGWRAVILDGLRADSSDDTLATLAETVATSTDGLGLLRDGAVSFTQTLAMTPWRKMSDYIDNRNAALVPRPHQAYRAFLFKTVATSTYGSGTSTIQIIENDEKLSTAGGSDSTTTIYSEAGGATTVAKTLDFSPYGFPCSKNRKCLVRILNSAAMSAATLSEYSVVARPPNR